ncbi:MAG TPA: vitamin K epoxide reductase family protein [Acidimicrobiales bacterium]|nr:vitamin K epoxide reductase family protein [Acidimicrobiales bacterium]
MRDGPLEAEDVEGAPTRLRWPWILGTAFTVVGFGISAYLTYEHFTGSSTLACPSGPRSIVNCLEVTTSPWSVQWGIPVAVLGLVFFAVMLPLQSAPAWRTPRLSVHGARVVWCVAGVVSVLRLLYFELARIHAICEWCTAVHLVTFLLFASTVLGVGQVLAYRDG